ncbi:hypothetical protein MES5069_360162 [Mesorhizobium escarrei]|uniref:MotA/TolQ/ExbB proton channel domain-containing protein n=1 Tax=Mesorhizobium escarrei TaxID=666018 RepID=A0ABN8K3R9_9HYPH|nr:hypothetical protein MES5069_360162 [Mesorhizobium escarrei]
MVCNRVDGPFGDARPRSAGRRHPRWFVVTMGGALFSAGAVGALVRGLTTTTITLEPRLASLLGVVAGLVVGLAYLIPQLILRVLVWYCRSY